MLRARTPGRALGVVCAFLALALGSPAVSTSAQQVEQQTEPPGGPEPPPTRPALEVGRLTGHISVDGRLDDAAWAAAPLATGFIQGQPVEGIPAEEETEVRVLLGEDALYVAARMYESDPSKIARPLVRRDEEGPYDYFSLSLDPNRDFRTGYNFRVSASNVQLDSYYYDDQHVDRAWNAVWESAVQVDERGWTTEMRIPLSQIRYDASDDLQTWGVNFARRRMSSTEQSYFSVLYRTRHGWVSQFGTLEGIRVPRTSRRIELRPYVLGGMHRGPAESADPFFDGSETSGRAGGDLRVGLGPAFTLDATFNPDFGQVEADPAVINLSAFESRFSERRPFFVEDAQVFDFSLGSTPMGDQLFYTRRIGRTPQGHAPGGADFSRRPDDATILAAMKLTGRTQAGLSLGVLAAATDEERGEAYYDADGRREPFVAEPGTQSAVIKVQQDLNEGASQIGAILTGVRRDLPGDGSLDFLTRHAFSGGVRFEHQWNDRDWALSGFLAGTRVTGDSTAITRIQRSSNHYYQRPDASRFAVDSAATGLGGYQWGLQLARQNGRHWTGSVWLGESSPGFEINDLGYSRSSESLDAGTTLAYREIQPGALFKTWQLRLWTSAAWIHEALDDVGSWRSWQDARSSGTALLSFRGTFLNEWDADVNVSYSPDRYNFTATRGGPAMREPASWSLRGSVTTDERRTVSFKAGFNARVGLEASGDQHTVSGSVKLRPSDRLSVSVEPEYTTQTVPDQYVASTETLPFAPTYGRRYLFGQLERRSVSMETRIDLTVSPRLSFQLFAQPLLSSGDYAVYRQLAEARTYDFDTFEEGTFVRDGDVVTCAGGRLCTETASDGTLHHHIDFDGDGVADYGLDDRDFNVRSIVGNAVLRWEYRPGSTVFLVWQRRQAAQADVGDFDLGRDLDALIHAPADDRFMVKVSYWLGL